MKHLTTLLALLLSCSMLAQGPVEFPWNPDADGDDFIGVNDLMALLGEFDSVFSEEGLYLSADSLSAMYDVGNKTFLECQIACRNLPGRWSMPEFEDVIVAGEVMWLRREGYPDHAGNVLYLQTNTRVSNGADPTDPVGCFCVTNELPKVEYITCTSDDNNAFVNCCQERVSEGWWPLAGSNPASAGADFRTWSQAFWRWAE